MNRANWDERAPLHLAAESYDMAAHFRGESRLDPIVAAEIGNVDGLAVFHHQCHFGRDSLTLAQMGAERVLGLDFSGPAITAARTLSAELGRAEQVKIVESDIYSGQDHVPAAMFDLTFVTWRTIGWLPDWDGWTALITHALKPGGRLYFANSHPGMLVFDDEKRRENGMPEELVPYFDQRAIVFNGETDYADPDASLTNKRTVEWMHRVSDIVMALINAGMQIEFLHEHDSIVWKPFEILVEDENGMYRWPNEAWHPLAISISARKS